MDIVYTLLDCNTLEELFLTTEHITCAIGFSHFFFRSRRLTGDPASADIVIENISQQASAFLSIPPPAWVDPLAHDANLSSRPQHWHLPHIEPNSISGVVLSSPDSERPRSALTLIKSSASLPDASPDMTQLAWAQLTACFLSGCAHRLSAQMPDSQQIPILNSREKDCLYWSACGKTSWEIGQIIGVTKRTVDFHIGNAVAKLNVSCRRHAISRAITLGIIDLGTGAPGGDHTINNMHGLLPTTP
ncbi:helix-turn-helix transcriptional regulator [Rivihabitans pingtungensis]|uniref:helix-turn-helix transcriptional regulator n=1 Tax=Rivihabitans pingtungensis TaxID=1054498 RepID=UPI00235279E1|nr:LuxR family transcriptional regulator [Rivihabitans pingtungensis]MCK6436975.1 LuxR family transcriptional regulator [Rivihabitans pingtungensis]